MTIQKVAVLGSGVMGSGIAAQVANAGIPVVLLDMPGLAEKAVEKQLANKPPGFAHKKFAKLITTGDFDNDLKKLADCDLIIEAVLERIDIKHDVYKKVASVKNPDAIVASNTSTLPLHDLTAPLGDDFAKHFMITHFFNPPRFMRLLEVVQGKVSDSDFKRVCDFGDITLGKTIVVCKDTPGFIANRIGVYWLMLALYEAMRLGVTVPQADAIMGRPLGIPKTGVFGLFDLIGIDLMPLIAKSLLGSLPETDAFRKLYKEPELVTKMIADGYTGRKGKGGFYRINKENGGKVKEVIDLKNGSYAPQTGKVSLESIDAAKAGLKALFTHKDIGGDYVRGVMLPFLHYTASLVPEINDDISAIDEAMKKGYSWKYGPFEMIDKLGVDFVIEQFTAAGLSIPPILEKVKGGTLYKIESGKRSEFSVAGQYKVVIPPSGSLMLSDIKLTAKPILKNASASLWDLGDGIACFEITSKMNSVDPDILSLIEKSVELVKKDFKGLVIGNDGDNFSVGANLGFVLMAANLAAWTQIADVIKGGQHAMMALKFAPFPVVSSLSGMALGGGCEIVLHSNAVQAHIESYPGLVEVGVGLIPAWGGCKEMLIRHLGEKAAPGGMLGGLMATGGAMPAISKVFEMIATAKVAGSAEEGKDVKILRENDGISMNRARVLADAKTRCLEMAKNYVAPEPAVLYLPGGTARVALSMAVEGFNAAGKATPHDVVICKRLAYVLSGGDTDISEPITEQQLLDLEFEVFMEMVKHPDTLARIEHMLNTGKPLRN
jgi:3-hydroxyacyl-CoA dehydrogenase